MFKKLINKAVPKLYGFYFNLLSLFSKKKAGALALKVFSVPRAGKIKPFQKEFLATARHHKINYRRWYLSKSITGKAMVKTILFAHGWESNAWRWKYLIEPLQAKGYNIVAIDAPAHGASSGKEFNRSQIFCNH